MAAIFKETCMRELSAQWVHTCTFQFYIKDGGQWRHVPSYVYMDQKLKTNSQIHNFFSVTLHNYVTKRRKLAVMSCQSDEATYCSSEMSLKNLWVCFPVFHPYIKLGKRNIFTEVLLDIPKWIYSWIWEMMDIQKKTFSEWKNVSERQICLLKSSQ